MALMHRYHPRKADPLYGYWFFEAYYEAFAKQLAAISLKFAPRRLVKLKSSCLSRPTCKPFDVHFILIYSNTI